MKKAIITDHAYKRAKQRMGIKRKSLQKIADEALTFGVKRRETTGTIRKFLDKVYFSGGENKVDNIIAYNQYVYVFNGGIFITTIPMPSSLNKHYQSFIKKKELINESNNNTI